MATTKIPSPASVRRALTTLKKYGAIANIYQNDDQVTSDVIVRLDNGLLAPKKTTRKKPKHKKVIPQKILADSSEKMSVDDDWSILPTCDGGLYNNQFED